MVTYPSDWDKTDIGSCVHILQGGTSRTTNEAYWNGNIVWVTPGEITQLNNLFVNNSERKITELGLQNSSATLLPSGTILLCTRATIGDLAIAAKPLATNQGFKNLVCKKNVDNIFFSCLLRTCKEEMISRAIGTTFLEISKSELSKIAVHIPDYEEQVDIGRTLRNFDTYIDDLAELIEKKRGIRDGALEDLICRNTRLNGFEGEWTKVSFNQVITPKARIGWQGLKKNEYLRTGYSYLIGGTDFSHGTVNLDNIWHVSKDRYDMDVNIQVSENDVLVTKDGTIGKVALVPKLRKPATLNSGVFVFRTNNRLLPAFLFRVLSSSVFKEFIDTLSAGSTIKHLYQKDLKNLEFEIPVDKNEQKAIADVLTAMDEEIEVLEIEREKMIQIREGAMNDLLTGHVRLSV